jgi:hypothetical protein
MDFIARPVSKLLALCITVLVIRAQVSRTRKLPLLLDGHDKRDRRRHATSHRCHILHWPPFIAYLIRACVLFLTIVSQFPRYTTASNSRH